MGGNLIREARLRARLTQRELAERTGTTQSAIARWESGSTEPSYAAVMKAVRAAGFSIDIHLEPDDGSDLSQSRTMLRRSVEERASHAVHVTNTFNTLRAEAARSLRHAG